MSNTSDAQQKKTRDQKICDWMQKKELQGRNVTNSSEAFDLL